MILVTGGSGSGKSAYAEGRLTDYRKRGYHAVYLATMQAGGEEGKRRVERHRAMRAGKGFRTVEQPRDLASCIPAICGRNPAAVLLECVSNLVANEMFAAGVARGAKETAEKVLAETALLEEETGALIAVTCNVFEDGYRYDADTEAYLYALGAVNRGLAARAEEVIEVVAGIPVRVKGAGKE